MQLDNEPHEMSCALSLPNDGEVFLWLEVYQEDGRKVCGIKKLRGHLDLPPKEWVRVARNVKSWLEAQIKESGCEEIRFAGRWGRIFPDYKPFEKLEHGYRKLLTDG